MDGDDADTGHILEEIRAVLAEDGSLPPERVLAERLGIKRHRLRQALEQLRTRGEIGRVRVGRRPLQPAPASSSDLARETNPVEVIELRLMIEPALARLAALRASPAEIARILQAATPPFGASYGGSDLAFHKGIATGARNVLAASFCQLLRQVGSDARVRLADEVSASPSRLTRRDAEHRAIAEAIAARDPDAAEQAMRLHLAAAQRMILERFTNGVTVA